MKYLSRSRRRVLATIAVEPDAARRVLPGAPRRMGRGPMGVTSQDRPHESTSVLIGSVRQRVCRTNSLMPSCLLASLVLLAYAACAANIARADVAMTGRLEKASSLKAAPGEVQPLATSVNGDYRCADEYSVIGNKPYYFAIGNCRAGWTLEAVAYASENTETHEHSYGGYVGSTYSYCGWIDTRFPLEKFNSNKNSACTNGSNNATELEDSSFMEKYDTNNSSHDGNYVVNPSPCPEYANYRPWSTNNVEQELIRTAPAYAASTPGSRTPALKWRYTTKYSSTDGTGQYVMVRDARITGAGEGNWVFVPRSCLSSPLPANEGESINPPPPTATTGGFNSVTTTSANLTGSVNPNGLDTHYYIEWGREASKPYEAFAPTPYPGEDVGAGNETVDRSVEATGLKPGTLYYYRTVAQSPTGTSEGGLASFTTVAEPPEAMTAGASEVQQTQAKLNGTVNPKGADTHYYFQYGQTTEYGSSTTSTDAGSGTTALPVSATVTRLEPGTTYHYRLVASSTGGTVHGSDQVFTTSAPLVAFQANSGELYTYVASPYQVVDTTEGMMPGTSPSIAAMPGGGYEIAFQANSGELYTYSTSPYQVVDTTEGMMPGTSPSIVATPGGGYEIAFQANSGELYTYSPSPYKVVNTTEGMKPGTSPSIAATPGGEVEIAFQANSGELYTYVGAPYKVVNTTEGMKPGTSPSIAATPGGEYEIAFQANSGELYTYMGSPYKVVNTTDGMKPETSPSIVIPE
jgi:hypothetical protein